MDPEPMDPDALDAAAAAALAYVRSVDDRRVFPDEAALAALDAFDEPMPQQGRGVAETLSLLDRIGGPATVASTGPSYFGFVTGGTHPAALGAAWLADAWDQNAALPVMSPLAARVGEVVRGWLVDVLGLPAGAGVAFVTGATVANASCLAAARDALLAEQGWDAPNDGLLGAPPVQVVVGERVHSTVSKSLSLVGLGRTRVHVVPADDQGRMRAELLPDVPGPVLVCAQAGEVNTGAFDPFDQVADWVAERGGWLHVDGAFGLWAAVSPELRHLVAGVERADSWSTDAHKWLNVGYDCGFVAVRDSAAHQAAMSASAAYLLRSDERENWEWVMDSSRRARGFALYAAIRALGREGIGAMIDRCCALARRMADRLREADGLEVLNDVVLNQVLVRFGDDERTRAVIAAVQEEGTAWMGGTVWHGTAAMRISVSNWSTTETDAERTVEAILRAATAVPATA
jgi:glutamate/tyrosine decarboxylase-like PLP-dependent enzyme